MDHRMAAKQSAHTSGKMRRKSYEKELHALQVELCHLQDWVKEKGARLNCIGQILSSIPYKKVQRAKVKLPKRSNKGKYDDQASLNGRNFVLEKY
jgi:hypothetical protein